MRDWGVPLPSLPWLFLGVSLVGAWLTLNAFWPVRRPAVLATVSFFAGWLTTELAIHHLLWQLGVTAAFAWAGALAAWPGWLGLVITLISWWFLGVSLRRALVAEGIVEAALREALGEGYLDTIEPRVRERLAPVVSLRDLLLPFPMLHPEVRRHRDLVFSRGDGYELCLDVYVPRGRAGAASLHTTRAAAGAKRPVLLFVHGGGWVIGQKEKQGLPLMLHLASRGWVCMTVDYRLSPRATFPDPLVDLKRAIRWARTHAARFGGDPELLVLTGNSAGAHLASLAALTANDPEYQPGFEHEDTRVEACLAFYGVYDFTDKHGVWPHPGLRILLETAVMKRSLAEARDAFERASPMHRVHEGAPPFFAVHGENDTLVPVGEARAFVRELRAVSREPVAYAELPGAQHAFEVFPSLRTLLVVHGVERWLAWVVAREKRAAATRELAAASAAPRAAEPSHAEPARAEPSRGAASPEPSRASAEGRRPASAHARGNTGERALSS